MRGRWGLEAGACTIERSVNWRIYVQLGVDYGLPVLFARPVAGSELVRRYPGAMRLLPVVQQHGLPVLDALYQSGPFEQRKAAYLETLRSLGPGVSQIIIHCGYDDAELRAITRSAAVRDRDRRVFTDPDVRAEIQRRGIQVITWQQFRALAAMR